MNGGRLFGRTEAGYLAGYSDKRQPDIQTNGGRIFGQPEAGYSDERGHSFTTRFLML